MWTSPQIEGLIAVSVWLFVWNARAVWAQSFVTNTTQLAPAITKPPQAASTACTGSAQCYLPYIRPAGNTQSCDIWGPLCQTGSITVAVNLTSTTALTVVPCSSYLSAQAYSASSNNLFLQYTSTADIGNYLVSFGRSPECTSFAGLLGYLGNGGPESSFSFTNCPASQTTESFQDYIPPGVNVDGSGPVNEWSCCGSCVLAADQIQLAYFPDHPGLSCSFVTDEGTVYRETITATTSRTISAPALAGASTEVISGYTYISPSIYIKFQGTAKIEDFCAPVGSVLTSATVAVPAGKISTVSFSQLTLGETYNPFVLIDSGVTQVLNLDDLACPTWGLSNPFTSYYSNEEQGLTSYVYHTVGPPYNPLIIPPVEILSLEPAWASCGVIGDGFDFLTVLYELFDPPIALTPAAQVILQPTSTDIQPLPPSASPASSSIVFAPSTAPVISPAPTVGPPQPVSSPPANPPADPSSTQPSNPPSNPPQKSPPDDSGSTPAHDPPSTVAIPAPISNKPQSIVIGGQTLAVPSASAVVVGGSTLTAGGTPASQGGKVFSVDPAGSLVVAPTPDPGQPAPVTVAIPTPAGNSPTSLVADGQTFAVPFASAVVVGSSMLAPGGAPVTQSGQVFSVDPAGSLIIVPTVSAQSPDMTIPLPAPIGTSNATIVADGQTLTIPAASTAIVDGTTLDPGSPAATVDGYIFSVNSAGSLVVAPASAGNSPSHTLEILTLNGETLTAAGPSGVAVAGTVLTAGGPALTIGGQVVTVEPSGIVAVGTATASILPVEGEAATAGVRWRPRSLLWIPLMAVWLL